MSSDQDFTPIDLHMHWTKFDGDSILLSRDGVRGNAHHIAKSLMRDHMSVATSLVKVGKETSRKGKFHVQRWKLRTLGWLQVQDVNQSAFAFGELAHGKTASEQGGSSV